MDERQLLTLNFKQHFSHGMVILLYVMAAASGAVGGCSVAALKMLRNKDHAIFGITAYMIIGFFFGLVVYGALDLLDYVDPSLENFAVYGGLSGFAAASLLTTINFSIRFLLKRLGIEVVLEMRPLKPD